MNVVPLDLGLQINKRTRCECKWVVNSFRIWTLWIRNELVWNKSEKNVEKKLHFFVLRVFTIKAYEFVRKQSVVKVSTFFSTFLFFRLVMLDGWIESSFFPDDDHHDHDDDSFLFCWICTHILCVIFSYFPWLGTFLLLPLCFVLFLVLRKTVKKLVSVELSSIFGYYFPHLFYPTSSA